MTTTHTRARVRRGYGWRPSLPDHRDIPLQVEGLGTLPSVMNLRQSGLLDWPVYDQGALGSCTANAIAGGLRFAGLREGLPPLDPSRLFIYYEERALEGTVASDSGAEIRDGLKVVAGQGYPSEDAWPYDVARFAESPPPAVVAVATKDHVTRYYRVATEAGAMKQALATGYPVVVGFTVYESFEDPGVAKTGVAHLPGPDEGVLGGHAVLLVGYDDTVGEWICRNSWGAEWGDGGYFYLPYGYLDSPSLAGDFWVIQLEVQE